MIKERFAAEIGVVALRLFRQGLDTLQIAHKLHILKPTGKPNEARVCDMLHAARIAEAEDTKRCR